MESLKAGREFLRADIWEDWRNLETDQKNRVQRPPPEQPWPDGATLIDLVSPEDLTVGTMPLIQAIGRRKSRRRYTSDPLTLEELSFLLWSTQGVQETTPDGSSLYRTVPSAGARHPFETYLLAQRVTGLEFGLYRYLSLNHELCFLRRDPDLVDRIHKACFDQYVSDSAVVLIWTAIPYRMEWRYGTISPKLIALDAGHVCQNLYLACESIGAGTCAIGAYDQKRMDAAIDVDGQEEFTVYLAPVGRIGDTAER
ncbi:MAG: SagB/ThcOx family dehydrogenase [Candidatus Latescibacteria bacterium]|jgi:SagB-type dehydrogenase family enzyme|nr:SagB/ThcOx family dehydrogenase [Candidatus Latescibacterota bacterium]